MNSQNKTNAHQLGLKLLSTFFGVIFSCSATAEFPDNCELRFSQTGWPISSERAQVEADDNRYAYVQSKRHFHFLKITSMVKQVLERRAGRSVRWADAQKKVMLAIRNWNKGHASSPQSLVSYNKDLGTIPELTELQIRGLLSDQVFKKFYETYDQNQLLEKAQQRVRESRQKLIVLGAPFVGQQKEEFLKKAIRETQRSEKDYRIASIVLAIKRLKGVSGSYAQFIDASLKVANKWVLGEEPSHGDPHLAFIIKEHGYSAFYFVQHPDQKLYTKEEITKIYYKVDEDYVRKLKTTFEKNPYEGWLSSDIRAKANKIRSRK